MIEAFYRAGAETAVGFSEEVSDCGGSVWVFTFWNEFRAGFSVEQATAMALNAVIGNCGAAGNWDSVRIVGNRQLRYAFEN